MKCNHAAGGGAFARVSCICLFSSYKKAKLCYHRVCGPSLYHNYSLFKSLCAANSE